MAGTITARPLSRVTDRFWCGPRGRARASSTIQTPNPPRADNAPRIQSSDLGDAGRKPRLREGEPAVRLVAGLRQLSGVTFPRSPFRGSLVSAGLGRRLPALGEPVQSMRQLSYICPPRAITSSMVLTIVEI